MKKNFFLAILTAMIFNSCQDAPEVADIEKSRAEINSVLDKQMEAMKNRDIDSVLSFMTEDALVCGTDPGEFWNMEQISKMYRQMVTDTSINIDYKIDLREVKISADGNSAIAVEQMLINFISPEIMARRVCHLVKVDGRWMINFDSTNMIPENGDLGKLTAALVSEPGN